jgi:anti-anti-sigma factor
VEDQQIQMKLVEASTEDQSTTGCTVRVGTHVGHIIVLGDLDLASRSLVEQACLEIDANAIVVDLSGLEFLDCCGYRALETARLILELRGGSLVWHGQIGQPARLLRLLARLDNFAA